MACKISELYDVDDV